MFDQVFQAHPSPEMREHLRRCFPELSQEEREIRTQEFLKFICLQSMKDSGFIPVTQEIDLIWHEYILQTRAYEKLCHDLPGKKFVHHQTISFSEYASTQNRKQILRAVLDWLPMYRAHFGEFTEKTAHYWWIVTFLLQELKLTIHQVNQLS